MRRGNITTAPAAGNSNHPAGGTAGGDGVALAAAAAGSIKLGELVTAWLPYPSALSNMVLSPSSAAASSSPPSVFSGGTVPRPVVPLTQCVSEYTFVDATPLPVSCGSHGNNSNSSNNYSGDALPTHSIAAPTATAAAALAAYNAWACAQRLRFMRIQGTLMEVRMMPIGGTAGAPAELDGGGGRVGTALHSIHQDIVGGGGGSIAASSNVNSSPPSASARAGAAPLAVTNSTQQHLAYIRFRQENDNRNGAWVPLSFVTMKSSAAAVPPPIVALWARACWEEERERLLTRGRGTAADMKGGDGGAVKEEESHDDFVDDGYDGLLLPSFASSAPLPAAQMPLRAIGSVLSRVPYDPNVSPEIGEVYVEGRRGGGGGGMFGNPPLPPPPPSSDTAAAEGGDGATMTNGADVVQNEVPVNVPVALHLSSLGGGGDAAAATVDGQLAGAAGDSSATASGAPTTTSTSSSSSLTPAIVSVHSLFPATASYLKQCVEGKAAVEYLEMRLSRDFRSPVSQCRYFLYMMVPCAPTSSSASPSMAAAVGGGVVDIDGEEGKAVARLPSSASSPSSSAYCDGFAFPPWYYSPIRLLCGGAHQTGPLNPTDGVAGRAVEALLSPPPHHSMHTGSGGANTAASPALLAHAALIAGSIAPPALSCVGSSIASLVQHSGRRPKGGGGGGGVKEALVKKEEEGEEEGVDAKRRRGGGGDQDLLLGQPFRLSAASVGDGDAGIGAAAAADGSPLSPSALLVAAACESSSAPNRALLLDLHLCPFTLRMHSDARQQIAAIDRMMEVRLARVISMQNTAAAAAAAGKARGSSTPPSASPSSAGCAYPLCPPGTEMYRDTPRGVSVYFLAGDDHRPYVRNLFLLTKSFLENKLVGHDVALYNVYCVCLHTRVHFPKYHAWLVARAEAAISRRRGASPSSSSSSSSTRRLAELMVANSSAFAGFYSTEEGGAAGGYNLACIMSLPCFGWSGGGGASEASPSPSSAAPSALAATPGKGVGSFIIRLSYEVAYRKGYIGTPERPLSDLGERAYHSYWRSAMMGWMGRVVAAARGAGGPSAVGAAGAPPHLSEELRDLLRSAAATNGNANTNKARIGTMNGGAAAAGGSSSSSSAGAGANAGGAVVGAEAAANSIITAKGGGGGADKKTRRGNGSDRKQKRKRRGDGSDTDGSADDGSASSDGDDDDSGGGNADDTVVGAATKRHRAEDGGSSAAHTATAEAVSGAGKRIVIHAIDSEEEEDEDGTAASDAAAAAAAAADPLAQFPEATRRLIARGLQQAGSGGDVPSSAMAAGGPTAPPLPPPPSSPSSPTAFGAPFGPLRTTVEDIAGWAGISPKDALSVLGEMGVFHYSAAEGGGGGGWGGGGVNASTLTMMLPADVLARPPMMGGGGGSSGGGSGGSAAQQPPAPTGEEAEGSNCGGCRGGSNLAPLPPPSAQPLGPSSLVGSVSSSALIFDPRCLLL